MINEKKLMEWIEEMKKRNEEDKKVYPRYCSGALDTLEFLKMELKKHNNVK